MENEIIKENEGAEINNNEPIIFTDEQKAEIAKMIQSESDRRVSQALSKQKKEYEKKLSLSQLDETARATVEKDNRIAELEEQIRDFTILEQKNEIMKTLSGRGLPSELVDVLSIGEDSAENQAVIETFDKLFKSAVKAEVEKRLTSSVPKKGLPNNEQLTKDEFRKMSLTQQAEIFMNNPEQYKQLIK